MHLQSVGTVRRNYNVGQLEILINAERINQIFTCLGTLIKTVHECLNYNILITVDLERTDVSEAQLFIVILITVKRKKTDIFES